MPKSKPRECHFLIPRRRDVEISDGAIHPQTAWRWLEGELRGQFRGWTKAPGQYQGEWISSKSGKVSSDRSFQYIVAVPVRKLSRLRKMLRVACVKFAQQCIYLSIAGSVEYVEQKQ